MTPKPYTRADVELVERAIHDVTPPIVDGYVDGRDLLNAEACAVLDAIAAAGRLIPASTTPARTAIEEALTASEQQRWGDVPDRVAIAQWADEIHRRLLAGGHITGEPA